MIWCLADHPQTDPTLLSRSQALEYTPALACRGTNLGRDRFTLGDGQQPKQIVCHRPQRHIIHASERSLGDVKAVASAGGKSILGAPRLYGLRRLNLDAVELVILLGHYIVARKILVRQ